MQGSVGQQKELHQHLTGCWMEFLGTYIKIHKGYTMAIKTITVKFSGISPLLQNNPQTVDVFNHYSKLKKPLVKKGARRTDEDNLLMRKIDVESKLFMDDELGVYVPDGWLVASLATNTKQRSFTIKDVRGGIFTTTSKAKLYYDGMELVKSKEDISKNDRFIYLRCVKQGQVRIMKPIPIFHNWSFQFELEYEDTMFDIDELTNHIKYNAKYGGFGDFRPSFGRASCEVI